ncbi:MAG: sugar transferase, partial [Verrucomicrobiae bacterium]|nr:sugar transferase [Verrucomicrobiae bacterium]
MLGRQRQIRSQVQKVLDAALFGLGLYLAHLLRTVWQFEIFGGNRVIGPFEDYWWLLLIIIPAGPLFLHVRGFYDRPLLVSRRQTLMELLRACGGLTVTVIIGMWLFRASSDVGRSVVLFFGAISFVLLALKEELQQWWLRTSLGRSQMLRRLILVGTEDDTSRIQGSLLRGQRDNLQVVARLNINEEPLARLVELMHEHSANAVVINARHTYFGQMEQTIEVCEREGVEVWLLADFFKTQVSQTFVDDFYGSPMLVFRSGPDTSWSAVGKRLIDVFGSLILLVGTAPVTLLAALAIKLGSRGPVLFRQERSGLNGRPFTMLKFRSMTTDAEQRKSEFEALNEMTGPVFKIANDPRITRVGRLLRKFSIDELPQLLNVLKGEMSLVGPRPLPVSEVARFDDLAHRRRLSVKPGLTCLWQISGRNEVTDFKEWVRLDLEYIDNWSLLLDLKILVLTVPVVLTGAGA